MEMILLIVGAAPDAKCDMKSNVMITNTARIVGKKIDRSEIEQC